jgi:elongation factor Ts
MSTTTEIDPQLVKQLREKTNAGFMDCKRALVESGGDLAKAEAILRTKGIATAGKKAARATKEGIVASYIHLQGKVGVLVEVNCETDFVTRTDDFKSLAHDVAMHIAAAAPEYVSIEDVPAEAREKASAEFTEKVKNEGKPENMVPQIVEGMLKKYFAEKCLLEQPFIKNPDITVGQYVKEHVAKLGENIVVRRFSRLVLGEVA